MLQIYSKTHTFCVLFISWISQPQQIRKTMGHEYLNFEYQLLSTSLIEPNTNSKIKPK